MIPLYKGGGKDPLDTNSDRGITVSPALAKVLESLIHGRLSDVLAESGLPHTNQTAYQKNVSCAEAIFSTLEIVSNHCREGDRMYMCFYDLQTLPNTQFFLSAFTRQGSMARYMETNSELVCRSQVYGQNQRLPVINVHN